MERKLHRICVIMLLCLVVLSLAGCAYLVGRQAEAGNSIDFEELDPFDEETEIMEWYEGLLEEKGIYRLDLGDYTYILVTEGERPTGGYTLEVTSVTTDSDKILVSTTFTSPPEDAMVITVITYPSTLIRIPLDERDVELAP